MLSQVVVVQAFKSQHLGATGRCIFGEFKARLIYRVSSRTDKTTQSKGVLTDLVEDRA